MNTTPATDTGRRRRYCRRRHRHHRRRTVRPGAGLLPGAAAPELCHSRRRHTGWRRVAEPLGLAAPVHPRQVQRPARPALPRRPPRLPHQGRAGGLSGGLCLPVPPAGPAQHGRHPAEPRRAAVPCHGRDAALDGGERRPRHRRLPAAQDAGLCGGTAVRRRAAPLPQLQEPGPAQARSRPGGGGGQLRGGDRPGDQPHA